jgi:hypothetical protein
MCPECELLHASNINLSMAAPHLQQYLAFAPLECTGARLQGQQNALFAIVPGPGVTTPVLCGACADSHAVAWLVFLLLTWLHVLANIRALRCLVLTSLNQPRVDALLSEFTLKVRCRCSCWLLLLLLPPRLPGLHHLLLVLLMPLQLLLLLPCVARLSLSGSASCLHSKCWHEHVNLSCSVTALPYALLLLLPLLRDEVANYAST